MNRLCTAVNDMRLYRKRFSISGSLLPLLLLLVLLVAHTSGRPSFVNGTTKDVGPAAAAGPTNTGDIDDSVADIPFDAGDDYADVDNVEWHHVKIVDGIMHEDHPIIMYKEDFVSEDYDPSQQHKASSIEGTSHARRRYKHLQRQRLNRTEAQTAQSEQTEKYHALKPEKIYFDILPPTPVVVTDDSSTNDSKFDPANIRVEVISLLDDEDAGNKAQSSSIINGNGDVESPSKELLNKRPKKYHHHPRMRRDTDGNENREHTVHKRHPHYNYERVGVNSFDDYEKHLINFWGKKHAVPGNKWNGIDGDVPPAIDFGNRFGGEDNTDRVVWGVSKANNRPATRRPQQKPQFPPLIHNSNPEDADFSAFTTRGPIQNNNRRPTTTRRPQRPQFPPLLHNSNPEDADFSAFNSPPQRKQQEHHHHRQVQRLSFASGLSNSKSRNIVNLENGKAETEPKTNVYDITVAVTAAAAQQSKSKSVAQENAANCENAARTCCEVTELTGLYDCFYHLKCTRSIAQIMAICA